MSKVELELIKENNLEDYVDRYSKGTLKTRKILKAEIYSIKELNDSEKDNLWLTIVRLGRE